MCTKIENRDKKTKKFGETKLKATHPPPFPSPPKCAILKYQKSNKTDLDKKKRRSLFCMQKISIWRMTHSH